MPADGIVFDAGWVRFKRVIDPRLFTARLRRSVGRATARNALLGVRQVRRELKGGVPPANAPLTAELKGGSKPLVGTKGADLFNAVTSDVVSWDLAIVGAKRMSRNNANVAAIVHQGARIRVTAAMRTMFLILAWATKRWNEGKPIPHLEGRALELWQASRSKQFYPLEQGTREIVIPSRPFIRYAFQDPVFKRTVELNWSVAVTRALSSRRA